MGSSRAATWDLLRRCCKGRFFSWHHGEALITRLLTATCQAEAFHENFVDPCGSGLTKSYGVREFLYTPFPSFSTYIDHVQPYFFNFFLVKKTNDSFKQKKPGGIGNGVSQPLLCIVFGDLIDSMGMCLGPAQSTRKEGLPSPSVGNQIMWQFGMMSDWKVYFHLVFFWDLLYKKAQDFRKYSGNWQLFLVEIWVSCCQTVWCILIVGRCFTLKPTRGSALNSDFFLTARDVMMDRWDPSNSGADILAENWWLEDEFFLLKMGQTIQWTFNIRSFVGECFY